MISYSVSSIAVLPRAPANASPVPSLTSLYHKANRGPYGDASYPGNCSGELIKDLLLFFQPKSVLDPMTGSGTCRDVCRELGIPCLSFDIREGRDATATSSYAGIGPFDFVWLHPPYWRMKSYTADPRDLSNAASPTLFYQRYKKLILQCARVLSADGKLAILMGDYSDSDYGFLPLTHYTKEICFGLGLKQSCTDIVRFSHGASSSKKTYRSSFIPGLHDICTIMEKMR